MPGLEGSSHPLTHKCLPALVFQTIVFIPENLLFYSTIGEQTPQNAAQAIPTCIIFSYDFHQQLRASQGVPHPVPPLRTFTCAGYEQTVVSPDTQVVGPPLTRKLSVSTFLVLFN